MIIRRVLCKRNFASKVATPLDCTKTAKAIGAYSKAVRVNLGGVNLIFCSGSIGVSPATGQLISQDVAEQTKQAMENIKNILEENNSSLAKVVKTTIFIDDMANYKLVNEVYSSYFTGDFPARSAVAVKELPIKAKVEIECIAANEATAKF